MFRFLSDATSRRRAARTSKLELATSCVTGRKHALGNGCRFNPGSEKTGVNVAKRLWLGVARCVRLIVGSLHFPLQFSSCSLNITLSKIKSKIEKAIGPAFVKWYAIEKVGVAQQGLRLKPPPTAFGWNRPRFRSSIPFSFEKDGTKSSAVAERVSPMPSHGHAQSSV